MMVKGVSKRIIVVKGPLNHVFEEAIFIVRDSALKRASANSEQIVREACAVANEYVKLHCGRRRRRFANSAPAVAAAGAALTGMAWLLYSVVR